MFDEDYDEELYLEDEYYRLQERREELLKDLDYYKNVNKDKSRVIYIQNRLDDIDNKLRELNY
jgi:uncharacterized protein (UPF0332 family)